MKFILITLLLIGCNGNEIEQITIPVSNCKSTPTGATRTSLVRPGKPHYGKQTLTEIRTICEFTEFK